MSWCASSQGLPQAFTCHLPHPARGIAWVQLVTSPPFRGIAALRLLAVLLPTEAVQKLSLGLGTFSTAAFHMQSTAPLWVCAAL